MLDVLSTCGLLESGVVDVVWNHGWREPKCENFIVHGIRPDAPTTILPKQAVIACHTQNISQIVPRLASDGKYILICRDTDSNIDTTLLNGLRCSVKHVFAINVICDSTMVTPMPYSVNIENREGLPKVWEKHLQIPRFCSNKVLASVNIESYKNIPKHERLDCVRHFAGKPWATSLSTSPEDYLKNLRSHDYLASPVGFGFERIAFCEAIILGCVPISLKHKALLHYADMPMAFVDNWQEVTEDWCDRNLDIIRRKPLNKATLSYWVERIRSTRERLFK